MADGTKIEWTDATWNPITGCQVKSPACRFCYAMKLAGTRLKHHWSRKGLTVDSKNGPVWTGEVRFNEEWLTQPLQWSKPRAIFVCAHADLFYEAVPDEWIDAVFTVMVGAPQHSFQVLTKRPDRMLAYLTASGIRPVPNVWLGVSVEDQERADEWRAPLAELATRGWITWVSYEPALGLVDWTGWEFIKGMVSGGESDTDGKSARPSNVWMHRQARDFSAANGIAYNFKQWGCWVPEDQCADAAETYAADLAAGRTWRWTGEPMRRRKKSETGRLLDGRTHDGFPLQLLARKAASA